jgi:predicted lipid carrier protein YhbT
MSGTESKGQIEVRLANGASSGLASIVQQFLTQQLDDSAARRVRAARLRGRLGLTATDYRATVTVEFRGDVIEVLDSAEEPLDASIAGPLDILTQLLQGRANPLVEHVRGRLRVRSRFRNLFLPLRVHRLMKLSPESH